MNDARRADLAAPGARRRDAGLSRRKEIALRDLVDHRLVLRDYRAMLRLVYSKIMDTHPNLKIITHHFAGIMPMLEGRLGPGNDVMVMRTTDGLCRAAQEPEEAASGLFQERFLGGYRRVHRGAGDQSRDGIFSHRQDRVRFRPSVRSRGGTMFPRVTLKILDIAENG